MAGHEALRSGRAEDGLTRGRGERGGEAARGRKTRVPFAEEKRFRPRIARITRINNQALPLPSPIRAIRAIRGSFASPQLVEKANDKNQLSPSAPPRAKIPSPFAPPTHTKSERIQPRIPRINNQARPLPSPPVPYPRYPRFICFPSHSPTQPIGSQVRGADRVYATRLRCGIPVGRGPKYSAGRTRQFPCSS